jgi:hypothetical protein
MEHWAWWCSPNEIVIAVDYKAVFEICTISNSAAHIACRGVAIFELQMFAVLVGYIPMPIGKIHPTIKASGYPETPLVLNSHTWLQQALECPIYRRRFFLLHLGSTCWALPSGHASIHCLI